jgi:hypothetical protein
MRFNVLIYIFIAVAEDFLVGEGVDPIDDRDRFFTRCDCWEAQDNTRFDLGRIEADYDNDHSDE